MQKAEARIRSPYSSDVPDTELARHVTQGDAVPFKAIMRRHNQLLFRTAHGIVESDGEAEDIVQEAWMRAWRAFSGFLAESKLSTWLVRIAVNEALGRLRRNSTQIIPLEAAMRSTDSDTQSALTEAPDRGPERSVQRSQVRALIEGRIDLLPEAFRSISMLRHRRDEC